MDERPNAGIAIDAQNFDPHMYEKASVALRDAKLLSSTPEERYSVLCNALGPRKTQWRRFHTEGLPTLLEDEEERIRIENVLAQKIRELTRCPGLIVPQPDWQAQSSFVNNVIGSKFFVPVYTFKEDSWNIILKANPHWKGFVAVRIRVSPVYISGGRLIDDECSSSSVILVSDTDCSLEVTQNEKERHERIHSMDPNIDRASISLKETIALIGSFGGTKEEYARIKVPLVTIKYYLSMEAQRKGVTVNDDELVEMAKIVSLFINRVTNLLHRLKNNEIAVLLMECKTWNDVERRFPDAITRVETQALTKLDEKTRLITVLK